MKALCSPLAALVVLAAGRSSALPTTFGTCGTVACIEQFAVGGIGLAVLGSGFPSVQGGPAPGS